MADSDTPVFEINPNSPPRPFAVAAWLGMTPDAIMAGLRDGSIAPPRGAPAHWLPPGLTGTPASSIQPDALPATSPPSGLDPSIPPVVSDLDRDMVHGWFSSLDSSLTNSSFDAIWARAGNTDVERAASLAGYLSRSLLDATLPSESTLTSQQDALSTFVTDPAHRAKVVDLAGMDGAALADAARTDIGYRVALANLDSVALVGNRSLFAAVDANATRDRFDPDTGESVLSDAWLADRSEFLAWKMASDAGQALKIDGAQDWSFVDRATIDASGKPLTIDLAAVEGTTDANQVIFGADISEAIKGQRGTDRVYGGGGDDILRGEAGADHLEGGRGDDVVFGGSGNDEVVGNQGNDDLDGDRGDDTLDGGSGDDTLAGGRGDDQLAGGSGADTYVIDAGDGRDTIVDSDGQGAIVLDDDLLAGAAPNQDGNWVSSDGRIAYSIDGDLAGESTLTIRASATDADPQADPDNVIQVRRWHNGDLGITLGANGASDPSLGEFPGDLVSAPPMVDSPSGDAGSGPTSDGSPSAAAAEAATVAEPEIGAAVANGQAPASDAPQVAAPSSDAFDADGALAQLLGNEPERLPVVDLAQLHRAEVAFGGVPTPPDVSFASAAGGGLGIGAVGIADITGALADDTGESDFGQEAVSAIVPVAPDWHRIESVSMPFDNGSRSTGIRTSVARP